MRRKGFTLIELVLVIAIISILAAMIIPRYTNMQTQAINKQEDAIITALKEAVNHKHMENVLNGNDVWPSGDPFTLLNSSSPHQVVPPGTIFAVGTNDNINWRVWDNNTIYPGYYECYISCPHYNGLGNGGGGRTKGKFYVYQYNGTPLNLRGTPSGTWMTIYPTCTP